MPTVNTMRATAFAGLLALGLGACSNPYDPGQRAVGGGLLGAGAGAAIGGIAGGGEGALVGGLLGGGVGALTGAATTPAPPRGYYRRRPPAYGYRDGGYRGGGYRGYGY